MHKSIVCKMILATISMGWFNLINKILMIKGKIIIIDIQDLFKE